MQCMYRNRMSPPPPSPFPFPMLLSIPQPPMLPNQQLPYQAFVPPPPQPKIFLKWVLGYYDQYFFINGLSIFSLFHLILSQHVIILSQDMLISLSIFSQDLQSLLCLHSLLLIFMLYMAMLFFSSLPFDASCITHVMLPFYASPF